MRLATLVLTGALLSAFFMPAHAEKLWVHAGSKHWDNGDYNEFNPGLGIELPILGRWSVEGGVYHNSHRQTTRYIWGGYSFYAGNFRIRPVVGIIDGYHETSVADGTALPVTALSVEYHWARVTVLPGAFGFSARVVEW